MSITVEDNKQTIESTSYSYSSRLGPWGVDQYKSETETMFRDTLNRFATDVMRPAGIEMDRLSAKDAIGEKSPLWKVLEASQSLGLVPSNLAELEPVERAHVDAIISEELAYGDAGIGGLFLVSLLPAIFAEVCGKHELSRWAETKMGCWAITEPSNGSGFLGNSPEDAVKQASCKARFEGDHVVINGQKSAWVSNAMLAELCILMCSVETPEGVKRGTMVLVPLDSEGVTRGVPLEKMGLRNLNQGELYFNNVKVPLENVVAMPEEYEEKWEKCFAEVNPHVGAMGVGIARAAYEYALNYAMEQRSTGKPLIEIPTVQTRLFEMFRKVEAARATVVKVMEYNAQADHPALHASMAAKVTGTQTAFEVASEAIQILGGNGVTHEYPLEKMFRDGRAMCIADGCNEFLRLQGGQRLVHRS